MIKAKIKTTESDRPQKLPYPHPYWKSAYDAKDKSYVVTVFADNEEQILEYWPKAVILETEEAERSDFWR